MYEDEESKLMLEKMYPITEALPPSSTATETWSPQPAPQTVIQSVTVEPTLYEHLTKIAMSNHRQSLHDLFQEMFSAAAANNQVADWLINIVSQKPWAHGFQDQLAAQPPLHTPSAGTPNLNPLNEPTPASDASSKARLTTPPLNR